MSRPLRVTLISVISVALVLAFSAGSYLLSLHALAQSQSHWCQTLKLLTSKPVPQPADPAANPSRENAYEFYIHLKTLEHDFGC